MLVVAHAGHWLAQLLYVAPLLIFVVILVRAKLQERRQGRVEQPVDGGRSPAP